MNVNKMNEVIPYLLERRSDLIKLILAAFLLASGASIIANYLSNLFVEKQTLLLSIGILVILLVLFYLIYELLKQRSRIELIESIIAIDNSSKNITLIPRYKLSEELSETLQAIFIENEALKDNWFSKNKKSSKEKPENNLANSNSSSVPTKDKIEYAAIVRIDSDEKREKTKRDRLLDETIEYLILEELSTHLSSYFNNYESSDKFINKYTRIDFPRILLENRIINMLSTPFQDRAIFTKAKLIDNPPIGEICSIYGTDGSRFNSFELILPTGTKVEKIKEGHLKLENSRLILEIVIKNEGFSSSLPTSFEYNYLGITDNNLLSIKQIDLEIKSVIKPFSLIFSNGWQYHKWVDSFINTIVDFASFPDFLNKINWESNLTRVIVSNSRQRIQKKILDEKELYKTEEKKHNS